MIGATLLLWLYKQEVQVPGGQPPERPFPMPAPLSLQRQGPQKASPGAFGSAYRSSGGRAGDIRRSRAAVTAEASR